MKKIEPKKETNKQSFFDLVKESLFPQNNSAKPSIKKTIVTEPAETVEKPEVTHYITTKQFGEILKIKTDELDHILTEMRWQRKENKWTLLTKIGEAKGGEQKYNARSKAKYIMWPLNLVDDSELLDAIKYQTYKQKPVEISAEEKGRQYEEFVANQYRERGYTIWEHGKEMGLKDMGVDIVAKNGNELLLLQCKDWKENSRYKLSHKDIKAVQVDAGEFIKRYPAFQACETKIRFVISGKILDPSAYRYIKENDDVLDFEILKSF